MRIGDLVAYAHDRENVGLIVGTDCSRGEDNLLVLWREPSTCGRTRWFVSPEWLVLIQSVESAKS